MLPSRQLLAALERARTLGALGPGALDLPIAHAAGFLEAARLACAVEGDILGDELTVLDLGSGGGLPGLVVAELLPAARVTLLDGRTERARLLSEQVERLGWSSHVSVVGQRAEVAGHDPLLRASVDLVVARGFARPSVTAECAAPFLRVGGLLVVSEPPATDHAVGESRWSAEGCAALGLEEVTPPPALPWSYAVLRQVRACPDRWPRRVGIPEKRPLF